MMEFELIISLTTKKKVPQSLTFNHQPSTNPTLTLFTEALAKVKHLKPKKL